MSCSRRLSTRTLRKDTQVLNFHPPSCDNPTWLPKGTLAAGRSSPSWHRRARRRRSRARLVRAAKKRGPTTGSVATKHGGLNDPGELVVAHHSCPPQMGEGRTRGPWDWNLWPKRQQIPEMFLDMDFCRQHHLRHLQRRTSHPRRWLRCSWIWSRRSCKLRRNLQR